MKRVEFFGPMGAGKSTLYNGLSKGSLLGNHILAKKELYRILLLQVKQKSFLKYIYLKIISLTPIKHRVFSNYDFYYYLKDDETAARLIQFILSELKIEKSNDKPKTLIRLNYFLKDLADTVVLKKYSNKKTIIHDESLVQRGLSFALDKTLVDLESFFDNIILPDAVVYISAPQDILMERVKYRHKINNGFSGKKSPPILQIEDSHRIAEKISDVLGKKKNIRLLKIDSSKSISSNVLKISNWITEIHLKDNSNKFD